MEVHQLDVLEVVLALDRVFCSNLEEHFCNGRLGKEYIGVIILNVYIVDTDVIMSNECWLISESKFPNIPFLQLLFLTPQSKKRRSILEAYERYLTNL